MLLPNDQYPVNRCFCIDKRLPEGQQEYEKDCTYYSAIGDTDRGILETDVEDKYKELTKLRKKCGADKATMQLSYPHTDRKSDL